MTTEALSSPPGALARLAGRARRSDAIPILTIVLVVVTLWYGLAVAMNWRGVSDRLARGGESPGAAQILRLTLADERPMLPAPHQIVAELHKTVLTVPVTSVRSLVYHGWVTLSSTAVGFAMGTLLGILLAVAIVHVRVLDKSLMPWIVSSQTIPILAIAPIVIVVLGSIGLRGVLPKAIISAYLCFFPVAIGMVKGLTSPDTLSRDLMRTYSASRWQTFWKLRLPASLPFLFASLKVAVAISLVGAIVGELPTGAQAGLGARLLAGSYYGQTIQIWAALAAAAAIAAMLVVLIDLAERLTLRAMGGRP
jgi:NitT/TauT family transport system permease protein